MRCWQARLATLYANLSARPTADGEFCGDNAKNLSNEQGLRIMSRVRRGMHRRGEPMSLGALVQRSRNLRRARTTHPGKRFK